MNKSIELVTTTGLLMTTDRYNELITEIESLKAKLAQQAEALKAFQKICLVGTPWRELADKALNATTADVDNWMQGKKAEWEKGVVEDMCSKCTLIAGG